MAWTEEEKQLLIDNYSNMTNKELMELLHKTEGQLRGMKERLGLNTKFKPFTDEEKNIIINYYNTHKENLNLDELSNLIHRQKTSICRFAKKVGLTDSSRTMTEDSLEKLIKSLKLYRETDNYKNNIYLQQKTLLNSYAKNMHPKGMLGKHHSEDTRKKMSQSHFKLTANMSYEEKHNIAMKAVNTRIKNGGFNTTENAYSRCCGGYREDLGQYFRSAWEANIARILDYEDIEWIYEYKRFCFKEEMNGIRSYQPDFYLPQFDKWIEVKGWMDDKSKIRLKLFANQYPEENKKLILIDENFYKDLYAEFNFLQNWELNKKYD